VYSAAAVPIGEIAEEEEEEEEEGEKEKEAALGCKKR
jgi:hypothetical protein